MNADLENELRESPELRAVVDRLRASRQIEPTRKIESVRRDEPGRAILKVEWLVAASIVLALGLSVLFLPQSHSPAPGSHSSYGAREYHLSPEELIASQNADGSWQTDFLTRRNANLLRACSTPVAQIAYKKAVRNLRLRGLVL